MDDAVQASFETKRRHRASSTSYLPQKRSPSLAVCLDTGDISVSIRRKRGNTEYGFLAGRGWGLTLPAAQSDRATFHAIHSISKRRHIGTRT